LILWKNVWPLLLLLLLLLSGMVAGHTKMLLFALRLMPSGRSLDHPQK
jgi:hypothetical protein